jgi:hypothetical protein
VDDTVVSAVAGEHDDSVLGDAGLERRRLDRFNRAGRLVVRLQAALQCS